jgi:hypothetical protein
VIFPSRLSCLARSNVSFSGMVPPSHRRSANAIPAEFVAVSKIHLEKDVGLR